MYATTPEELRNRLANTIHSSPSTFLRDDSFAAWCYDHRSLRELQTAFEGDADPLECEKWNISPMEWRTDVEMAIIALRAIENVDPGSSG